MSLDKITVIYREYSKMCSIRYVDFTNPSPVSKKWASKDGKKSSTPLRNLESEMNQIENVKWHDVLYYINYGYYILLVLFSVFSFY